MMTSKNADKEAYVWVWLPDAAGPVVAGRLESDDQGHVQFNYGKSYGLQAGWKIAMRS